MHGFCAAHLSGESARGGHSSAALLPAPALSLLGIHAEVSCSGPGPTPTANATGASTTIWPNCSARRARALYAAESLGGDLKAAVYALDSTTIDLCLSLIPWARFRRTKAAIKLHTLLDLRGSIPAFIAISQCKQADVRVLDELIPEPVSFYVMDRGYVDFQRLYALSVLAAAFFVTRAKINLQFNRLESCSPSIPRPECGAIKSSGCASPRASGITRTSCGASITWTRRRAVAWSSWTNNFALLALTIALLYKGRWQVELFFKWIKQHLRIKHFYGTSDNAGENPDLISICVYVLVATAKKLAGSNSEPLQYFADFELQRI